MFGNQRAEENKMHKFINELCREYQVGPKSKMLDLIIAKEMLKNCTDNWASVLESLPLNSVDSKINMNSFKDNIKEIIKSN